MEGGATAACELCYKQKNRWKSSMARECQQYERRCICCAQSRENTVLCVLVRVETLAAGIAMKASIHRAPNEGHAEFPGKVITHGGHAVARHNDGYAALRRLDHHLSGEPSGGEQHFVAAADAMLDHPAADGVERIVPADIFNGDQQAVILKQRAAVHGSCVPMDAVMLTHHFENPSQCAVFDARLRRAGQANGVHVRLQAGKYRSLAAGARNWSQGYSTVLLRRAGPDRARARFPVDDD